MRKREIQRELADRDELVNYLRYEKRHLMTKLDEIVESRKNPTKFMNRFRLHGLTWTATCNNPMCEGCHGGG